MAHGQQKRIEPEDAECPACGADVLIALSKSGSTIFLDAEPDEDGNFCFTEDGRVAYLSDRVIRNRGTAGKKAKTPLPEPRYFSHTKSCEGELARRRR